MIAIETFAVMLRKSDAEKICVDLRNINVKFGWNVVIVKQYVRQKEHNTVQNGF